MGRKELENMVNLALDGNYVDFQKGVHNELNSRISEFAKELKGEIIDRANGLTEAKDEDMDDEDEDEDEDIEDENEEDDEEEEED